jgi:Mg-chelatase subunit ChlD
MIFRARFINKIVVIAGILLISSTSALADPYPYSKHIARQDTQQCIPGSIIGQINSGNGGRKIGIVIDASNSMSTNDPNDIRLAASNALDDVLISQSEATNGKTADLVTVVDFAATSDLLYPLGDPAGASSSINGITLSGGTAIGAGVKTAIDELTKPGNDPTANRTGIVVFTDGEDSPVSGRTLTIDQIKRAGGLGIRVSFGFLSVDSSNQNREILSAILESGGIYVTIGRASDQQTFISLVLAHGLTGIDTSGTNSSTTLIPGLGTAAFLSQTGPNTFTYTAKASETFNITVTAIDPIDLTVTLRDVKTNTDIKSNSTGSTGVAFLEYTAPSDMDVEVVVTAANTSTTGIFSISLNSSIPFNNNCTITSNTSTSSSTSSQPPVFTGGVASLLEGSSNHFVAFFSVFCFAVAAAVL